MVTHSNKEVEEEHAALLHLLGHCCATLESIAAADDEGQIMGSKLRVMVGGVGVCPTSRGQQRRHCNIGLQALLAKSKAFEVVQTIGLCGTTEPG